ncbi:hypothetical protein A0H76_453 [Hepatospora eriocheir]|uniref:Uncharacterized protein n=1 Tax=Hepatospora eriocheir TaxID=1081669 RepID=A0A1X0QIS8_9MICR|nr:hypothetical protein A0H76_453 [Hepatospora eriocheir]
MNNKTLKFAIEKRIKEDKLEESLKNYIENITDEDIKLIKDSFTTLKGDLKRTPYKVGDVRDEDTKIKLYKFYMNLSIRVFEEAKVQYSQGMLDWLSVLINFYFSNKIDINKYEIEKEENENNSIIKYKELFEEFQYQTVKNKELFKEFLDENEVFIHELVLLAHYYDMKFNIFLFDAKVLIDKFTSVFNDIKDEFKETHNEAEDFFYCNQEKYVCWFARNISKMEYLFKIYAKILIENTTESIFIIYHSLIKKYLHFKQEIDLDNESLKFRFKKFDAIYLQSKIRYKALKENTQSSSSSIPYITGGAAAVGIAGIIIGFLCKKGK